MEKDYHVHFYLKKSVHLMDSSAFFYVFVYLLLSRFLDLLRLPERSYKIGSFYRSVCLSGHFLDIGLLVFLNFRIVFETHEVVRDRAEFWRFFLFLFCPRLQNSLLAECFPLICDLIGFKSRVGRHI